MGGGQTGADPIAAGAAPFRIAAVILKESDRPAGGIAGSGNANRMQPPAFDRFGDVGKIELPFEQSLQRGVVEQIAGMAQPKPAGG